MPKPFYITALLVIIFFLFNSCRTAKQNEHLNWVELQLPLGWSIRAPKGFKIQPTQGCMAFTGDVLNESGKLIASYEVPSYGYGAMGSFSENVQKVKKEITDSSFKKAYNIPAYNTAYLDTINGMIATIIKPVNNEKQVTYISIADLATGVRLNIYNGIWIVENLSSNEELLLLEMFKTIRFRKVRIADFYKGLKM